MNRLAGWADCFGMTAAAICLLHCIGMSLLLVVAPLFGFFQLEEEAFHQAMAIMVTLPALLALIPGFIVHCRRRIALLGGIGLACFLGAVLLVGPSYGETAESILAGSGG